MSSKRTRKQCKQSGTVGKKQCTTRQKKCEPIPFPTSSDDDSILNIFAEVIQKSKSFCNGASNDLPIGSLTHTTTLVASICSTIDRDYKLRVTGNNDRQQRYFPYGARLMDSVENVVALLGDSLNVRKSPQETRRERLEMGLKTRSAPYIVLILFDVLSIRDRDTEEAFCMLCGWARDPAYHVGLIVTFSNEADSPETFPGLGLVRALRAIPFHPQFEHDEFVSEDHRRQAQQPQTGQPDTTKDLDVSIEQETFSQRDQGKAPAFANGVASKEKLARIAASFLSNSLTPYEKLIVDKSIHGQGRSNDILRKLETVSAGKEVSVTRGSMRRLKPGVWLNDEIVNFFFRILQIHDEELSLSEPMRNRNHFFTSFFYKGIHFNEAEQYEYNRIKKWTKDVPGKDIFKLHKIFFPINIGEMHWVCVVVQMKEREILMYDSLGGDRNRKKYLETIFRYLKDEHMDKKGTPLPEIHQWKLRSVRMPVQNNGHDCGVFVCIVALFLSMDLPLQFNQSEISLKGRERIALSIMQRSLLAVEET
jgi:sentrin-specific protease 1